MGGSSGGDTTTTQVTEIPDFLKPFLRQQARTGGRSLAQLEDVLSGAGADELVAPFTADQLASFGLVREAVGPGGAFGVAEDVLTGATQGVPLESFVGPQSLDTLRSTAGGDFLFGGPGFDAAVEAAVNAARPGIISTFGGGSAATGGLARAAIAEAATDEFASQFATQKQRQLQAAGVLADLGQARRIRQLRAAGQLPGIAAGGVDLLGRIGAIQQAQSQRELSAPLTAQQILLAASGGGIPLAGLLGTRQTGPGLPQDNRAAGFATGALGGAATGATVSGGNPFGIAAGALIGGFGGAFA